MEDPERPGDEWALDPVGVVRGAGRLRLRQAQAKYYKPELD